MEGHTLTVLGVEQATQGVNNQRLSTPSCGNLQATNMQ
jgi:hypothetical protein